MNRAKKITELQRVASTQIPTEWGIFQVTGFQYETLGSPNQAETAVALAMGDLNEDAPLLRIHSQCLTGDVFGSLRCDCGEQLKIAMRAIAREGRGLVIYEQKEGRGIGLMAKLQAYSLQDVGLDTIEANHALGFVTDCRTFDLPVAILQHLGIYRVRLLSNNQEKFRALVDGGIEVVKQISCEAIPNPYSIDYLRTKKDKMGHDLNLGGYESMESSIFPYFNLLDAEVER
ncbi:GTP cyclohydrolase II [Acidicapsa ligni]|uniref:GTP cyclohydrolase II n=1 Tax=Acidicapsa ligni TaxID=542300 RepID=UPI0021E0D99C|nr:GTP cyclohydrolase II [Acidicapsa ligni]